MMHGQLWAIFQVRVLPSDTWFLYRPVLKAILSQILLQAQEKKEGTENRHRKGNIPVNQTMCLKNIVNFNRKSLKSNRFKLDQNNKSGWLHIFDSQGKETEMLQAHWQLSSPVQSKKQNTQMQGSHPDFKLLLGI